MSSQHPVDALMERHTMLARGRRVGTRRSPAARIPFSCSMHCIGAGLAAVVIHVNHKLRGDDSDRDEAFVAELARKAGLPFQSYCAPPAAGNLEQEARRARYRFFAEVVAEGACDVVATGHTLDDQAETVFLGRFH